MISSTTELLSDTCKVSKMAGIVANAAPSYDKVMLSFAETRAWSPRQLNKATLEVTDVTTKRVSGALQEF